MAILFEGWNERKIRIVNSGMGLLHEAVRWYKISPAGWQATHWDIQNK